MSRLGDLQRTLEAHALLAPDAAGLVAGAHAGAARIRRRRRITVIITAAVVVVLVAAAVPVTLRLQAGPPVTPARPGVDRQPWQLTVTIDASYPDPVVARYAFADSQRLTVEQRSGARTISTFEVIARDRGHAVPVPSKAPAEPTTVQGHPAVFTAEERKSSGSFSAASVFWNDPSGVQVEVSADFLGATLPTLRPLAEAVRTGPPRALTVPLRLGPLPDRLQVVNDLNYPHWDQPSYSQVADIGLESPHATLSVAVFDHFAPAGVRAGGRAAPAVAGHPAWTVQLHQAGWVSTMLTVKAGACWYQFSINTGQITADQLRAVAAGTAYADCTDVSTWTAPV